MIGRPKQKPHLALAETILREAREELSRADSKSSLLLAAAGVVVGAVAAAVVASEWSPFDLSACVQWIWWLGASAGIGALVGFAYAVYPVTRYRGERQSTIVTYFGDVAMTDAARLESRLMDTASREGTRTLDQLKIISDLVDKKYRGIQVGTWLAAASSVLCGSASIADYFI